MRMRPRRPHQLFFRSEDDVRNTVQFATGRELCGVQGEKRVGQALSARQLSQGSGVPFACVPSNRVISEIHEFSNVLFSLGDPKGEALTAILT